MNAVDNAGGAAAVAVAVGAVDASGSSSRTAAGRRSSVWAPTVDCRPDTDEPIEPMWVHRWPKDPLRCDEICQAETMPIRPLSRWVSSWAHYGSEPNCHRRVSDRSVTDYRGGTQWQKHPTRSASICADCCTFVAAVRYHPNRLHRTLRSSCGTCDCDWQRHRHHLHRRSWRRRTIVSRECPSLNR